MPNSSLLWRSCISLSLGLVIAFGASAQDPEEPAETPEGEPAPEGEAAPEEELPPMTGDIITFKSGTVWGNVQVLRSTPRYYEVEQFPGLAPVQIARSLVQSIEYDDIDPERERRLKALMPEPESPSVVGAEQLAPEFREKITAPFTQEPLTFTDEVIGQVFSRLSELAGVPIEIDESVRKLPPDQKLWTVTFAPGTTLLNVLQDELPKAFPTFRPMFEIDKVKVMTAEAMQQADAEPAPAATPQN